MVEGKPEIPPELAGYRDLSGADFKAASPYGQPKPETQPALDALADAHRGLAESHRLLSEENRALSGDIKALIARLDEIIRDQNNGA